MNRKGFTMVELLGTVVILGILMSVSILAFTRTRDSSAQKAFKLIHENVYDAAENYFMDTVGDNDVEIDELVEMDYLDPVQDPWDKEKTCIGKVEKTIATGDGKHDDSIDLYTYKIQVKCRKGCTCVSYPKKTSCTCDAEYQ